LYKLFDNHKDFGFKNQILRASVSIMNNVAEGFERRTNKEFKQYLYIAKGSAGEVRSMIYLAKDLRYIDEVKTKSILETVEIISRMLTNFIKRL